MGLEWLARVVSRHRPTKMCFTCADAAALFVCCSQQAAATRIEGVQVSFCAQGDETYIYKIMQCLLGLVPGWRKVCWERI
jgi:hypothetical protein